MANVFLSYQKRDAPLALRVVQLLNRAGLTVWWDNDLTPRESWDRIIDREIHQADKVLVLWTPHSVQSEWVRIEANYALNCTPSKLVQARFDAAQVPIAFSMRQYVDLDFTYPDRGPSWDRLLLWLGGSREGGSGAGQAPPAPPPKPAAPGPKERKPATTPHPAAAMSSKSIWAPIGLRAAVPDMPQGRVFMIFAGGMILYNLLSISMMTQNSEAFVHWMSMALFGAPMSAFGWSRSGRIARIVVLLMIIPLCHYLVVLSAVSWAGSSPDLFKPGMIGGAVGASLSFMALVLLGGTVKDSRWLEITLVATLALTVIGSVGLAYGTSLGLLVLYAPWQLVFGYALSLILTGSPPPWRRKPAV